MADAMKLLPCPFCGGPASYENCAPGDPCGCGQGWVACLNDECPVEPSVDDGSHEERIAAWNRRASPPAREEAPAEGEGGALKAAESIHAAALIYEDQAPLSDMGRIREIVLNALRNRTSEPEAGAVAWFGDGQYEPTEAMIEAGLETCRPGNHANMIASFKSMMQQAELDGLITAPATADKLKVAKEALEKIADEAPYRSGYCQSDVEYGPKMSDIEMQTVARQALAALNEQPQ